MIGNDPWTDLAVVQAGRAVATGDPRRANTLHDVETESRASETVGTVRVVPMPSE